MKTRTATVFLFLIGLAFVTSSTFYGADIKSTPISTNKDKVLTLAVQGEIAPAAPSTSYTTTWDGKPKMAIGIGGINYNLKIGDPIFGDGWTYETGENSVYFHGTTVPDYNADVRIYYRPVSDLPRSLPF